MVVQIEMAKSVLLTYIFWLFGGFSGLHHFYLNRDRHAFILWMTFGGYFGLGWFRDLWKIPEYVRDANDDKEYLEELISQMRRHQQPPATLARHIATIVVADLLGYLAISAVPTELIPNHEQVVPYIYCLVVPLAVAIGVHATGNVGRQEGSLKWALIGAYITAPLYLYSSNVVFWTSLASNYFFNSYSKRWRRTRREKRSLVKRVAILSFCAILYLSLWSSWIYFNCSITDKNEEEIKCRDAAKNFFKSPMWQECSRVFSDIKTYIHYYGWSGVWREIVEAFDPQGEKNALKVLELNASASQEEITSTYRKLARQWHPDRHKNDAEKQLAQERFIEIQKSYEILSKIKTKRIGKNQKSDL